MQSLDIISVNLWQMLVSLINLLLLFLIVKKFLYNPVKKMLKSRQDAIQSDYDDAEAAKAQAEADRQAYEEKLSSAKAKRRSCRKPTPKRTASSVKRKPKRYWSAKRPKTPSARRSSRSRRCSPKRCWSVR